MDKEKRKANYRRLRGAGFNAKDASLLKNRSDAKIDYLCEAMQMFTHWKYKAIQRTKGKGKIK